MSREIDLYWKAYLESLPELVLEPTPEAEAWGDNPELADELAALIVAGTKTATCSSLWEWEFYEEPLPQVGTKTIVLNSQDKPMCITETTAVTIQKFQDVDADFAHAEGEGDRSLETWRAGHWRYFTRVLEPLELQPTLEMPLVCERFKVIFKL